MIYHFLYRCILLFSLHKQFDSANWLKKQLTFSGQSVYISQDNKNYYTNGSAIIVTGVKSTNSSALNCHTDSTTCCRGIHNPGRSNGFGEWVFPNGSRIAKDEITGDGFYWIRFKQVVRLYRQGNIQAPLGSYCCRIPNSYGAMRTFCANLVGKLNWDILYLCDQPILN